PRFFPHRTRSRQPSDDRLPRSGRRAAIAAAPARAWSPFFREKRKRFGALRRARFLSDPLLSDPLFPPAGGGLGQTGESARALAAGGARRLRRTEAASGREPLPVERGRVVGR